MDLPVWWKHDKPYAIMDCLEGMRELPDKCVDLVLTDPPYGIGESNEKNSSRRKLCRCTNFGDYVWDKERIPQEFFDEMFRISKNQVIWGGNYYIDYLTPGPSWIVWDKDNGNNDFADCELAWTSHNKAVRKIKFKWAGMLQENMGRKEKKVHQTQKPIPLFEWIINNYSQPNDIILDPFLGSGTILRACRETGRIGLGFEIEKDYEPIIRKRMMEELPPIENWFM